MSSMRRVKVLASLLLIVLSIGGALHITHHLLDPDCESAAGAESHPCVSCSALHGGVVEAVDVGAAPPAALSHHTVLPASSAGPSADPSGANSSRAPPLV
jgi:hypothetical protein